MEWIPLVTWILVLAFLTGIGAPIAAVVFRPLPRGGAAFSLPMSMLVLTTVVFLLGQFTFGLHTVAIGMLAIVGLSAVASRWGQQPNWRAVAGAYAVFLVGFFLYLLYSSQTIGITPAGGEQFLHFGLTNALTHAETLPPEDFWFAGKPLRYYYGTQLQVALLSMLTGTPIRYGYPLGLATFYSMLFVGAYGLAGAIVASQGRSYRFGGLLGAVFVAVSGTLTAFVRLLFGWLPADIAREFGNAAFVGLRAERGMSFQEALQQGNPDEWFWFYTRYVIRGGLNEFPLYSFVKADLHGHTLSTAYIVVAGAIAFSYYQTPAEQKYRRLGTLYGGLGLVAGVFGFMNTWALPTAVGLAWLALAGAGAHPATLLPGSLAELLGGAQQTDSLRSSSLLASLASWLSLENSAVSRPTSTPALGIRLLDELWRIVLAGLLAIPVAVIGIAIASPFLIFGSVPTNDGIGLFPPRTALGPFLVLYGGLLALFAVYVLARTVLSERRRIHAVAGAVVCLLSLFAFVFDFAVATVTVPIMVGAWWLVRTERASFEAVLLVGGVGLLFAMEIVHAKVYPFNRVRWNTTLKVAVQGWTVAAVGAGAISALLLAGAKDRLNAVWNDVQTDRQSITDAETITSVTPAAVVSLFVIGILVTSLPFAVLVYSHNMGDKPVQEASIDGLAIHDQWKTDEMEAMYWLDGRSATIVEAPGWKTYHWKNPVSVFTDARAVVGWDHQEGYRGETAFETRASAVEDIYLGSWENATAALRKYDVDYIYVGPSERDSFTGIRNFWSYDGITLAYENSKVQIYRVTQSELDPSDGYLD